jgi:hypothetical protein
MHDQFSACRPFSRRFVESMHEAGLAVRHAEAKGAPGPASPNVSTSRRSLVAESCPAGIAFPCGAIPLAAVEADGWSRTSLNTGTW